MTFPIGCSVSFCLKTLPLNTSLFEETVFEKSRVFNLSRFKISICIWWWFRVRVRTFEITEWVFVRFFWNQLWLSFGVNTEINILRLVESQLKVFCEIRVPEKQVCGTCIHPINLCSGSFSEKGEYVEEGFSLTPRWTYYCFLCFYFSCWLKCILCRKWKVPSSERGRTICGLFKINTMTWVFFFGCVLLILTMICFCFLMVRMTGAGWCCRSGTLSTLFGNAP